MNRVKTLLSAQLGSLLPVLLLWTTFQTSRALAATSIVTGANGYVGREVVQVLLEDKEQTVVCLVRPSRVEAEQDYWKSSRNVRVMPYDMLDGGTTIGDAIKSCSSDDGSEEICVYHIASVFGPTEDHVQTANDNVQGTVDLVHALGKVPNARLVLTSSMAAVRGTGQDPLNGKFYTHKDWNTKSKLGENWGASYQWSKAESEKQATTLAKQYDLPMTSLCPSFVFGPPTDISNLSSSFSITLVGQWVRGESDVQSRLCVDIRDIARAHVAAGTREEAKGKRFVVSTEARIPSQDMAEALKKVCEESGLGDPAKITFDGTFSGGAIPIGEKEVEAELRLEEYLGVKLRPVEETIADMGRALLEAAQST